MDAAFASLPDSAALRGAKAAYLSCLALRKAPAAPSDNLGQEFEPCRAALLRALHKAGLASPDPALTAELDAVEAEMAGES